MRNVTYTISVGGIIESGNLGTIMVGTHTLKWQSCGFESWLGFQNAFHDIKPRKLGITNYMSQSRENGPTDAH